jgi:hypothetical protein
MLTQQIMPVTYPAFCFRRQNIFSLISDQPRLANCDACFRDRPRAGSASAGLLRQYYFVALDKDAGAGNIFASAMARSREMASLADVSSAIIDYMCLHSFRRQLISTNIYPTTDSREYRIAH